MSSILGFDIGSKRVGVAISRSGIIAEPLSSLRVAHASERLALIEQLTRDHQATTVVIGLPVREDGSLGTHGRRVEQLVDALREQRTGAKIVTVDEALTSKEAERLGGRSADHDALAASLILEQYLAERSREGSISD